MALPPPTDSIYKYVTAGGLALLVSSGSLAMRSPLSLAKTYADAQVQADSAMLSYAWNLARIRERVVAYPSLHPLLERGQRQPHADSVSKWLGEISRRVHFPECVRNPQGRTVRDSVPCAVISEIMGFETQLQRTYLIELRRSQELKRLRRMTTVSTVAGVAGALLGIVLFNGGLLAWYFSHQFVQDLATIEKIKRGGI